MTSDILRNIDVLGRECLWRLVPLSPRGSQEDELVCLCLVSAFVIRPVLFCSVMWRFVLSATRNGKYRLYFYRMENCQEICCFLHVSTPLLLRPGMRRMAMLVPPFRDGL